MLTMKSNLYNPDGTLSVEAQSLLSPKPAEVSTKEWQLRLKAFRITLSVEELIQFKKLRKKESDLAYRKRHYDTVRQREKEYKTNHGEKYKTRHKNHCKKYRINNKEKCSVSSRIHRKKWRHRKLHIEKDERYIVKNAMRQAVSSSFTRKGVKKNKKTEELLGASWDVVQARFESLFTKGMSWSNRGEWHVDHIRPVSSFEDPYDPMMNHYTNLQPLWAEDNLKKSDTWDVDTSSAFIDGDSKFNFKASLDQRPGRTGRKTPRVGDGGLPLKDLV